jgi:hypothetical protein
MLDPHPSRGEYVDAQMPTGYENYPRPEETERDAIAGGWENPPPLAPVTRSYGGVGSSQPSPVQSSRRSMLVSVVGFGVIAMIVISMANRPVSWGQPETTWEDPGVDPFDPGADDEIDTDVLTFGGLDLDVPTGWTVMADSDTRALLTQGHNQLLMVKYDGLSQDAGEELFSAIKRSGTAFQGKLTKAKLSTGDGFGRAVATGTGTFEGRSARQLAEALVSEDFSVLFIQQILTAKDGSAIAEEAARLAADLRDSWPW